MPMKKSRKLIQDDSGNVETQKFLPVNLNTLGTDKTVLHEKMIEKGTQIRDMEKNGKVRDLDGTSLFDLQCEYDEMCKLYSTTVSASFNVEEELALDKDIKSQEFRPGQGCIIELLPVKVT